MKHTVKSFVITEIILALFHTLIYLGSTGLPDVSAMIQALTLMGFLLGSIYNYSQIGNSFGKDAGK